MCGEIQPKTHEQWKERAQIERLHPDQGGGLRYEVTDIYGKDGQGLLIHDRMFPEDWRVTMAPDSTDTETFYEESEARAYMKSRGLITPTEIQQSYIDHGYNLFEIYDGKAMHEWLDIGELNRRKHVHPEPPADINDVSLMKQFVTAYAMTMTIDEALTLLRGMESLEQLLSRMKSPFDTNSELERLFSGSLF